MFTAIVVIALPEVMNGDAFEPGQDADIIHGFLPPLGMNLIIGMLGSGTAMQPQPLGHDPDTGFIEAGHNGYCQQRLDPFFESAQLAKGILADIV